MSELKKKISLVATGIVFKKHSIVYIVKPDSELKLPKNIEGIIITCNDIKEKDLLLKSNYLDHACLEVVFTPINVTPQFYQKIFIETNSKLSKEYQIEKADIYSIGETVGFVIF